MTVPPGGAVQETVRDAEPDVMGVVMAGAPGRPTVVTLNGVGVAGPIILGGHLDLDCGDSITKVDLVPIQRVIGIRDSGVVFVKELEGGIVVVGGDYRNPRLARPPRCRPCNGWIGIAGLMFPD